MDIVETNRAAWSGERTLRWFGKYEGWSDPGEQAAVDLIRDRMRGKRILDMGVGAGRTVPLMRAVSEDYVGLDFLEPMLELCRIKHPGVNVEWGDARDLSAYADGSFDLVCFSWNGIDAVDHDDRGKILDEVRRVLAPEGVFFFSSHNAAGPGCGEKPWTLRSEDLRHPKHIIDLTIHFPVNVRNHRRHRPEERQGDGWAIRNAAAHNFDIVIHYTTPDQQRAELADHGFEAFAVLDSTHGRSVPAGDRAASAWWCHYLASASSHAHPA